MSDTPFFIWLTPLDYSGTPAAQRAYNVNLIVDIGPAVEVSYQDYTLPGYDDNGEELDRTRSFTPGAIINFLGGTAEYGTWTLTCQEQATDIVRSIRCNRPQVSTP